MIYDSLSNINKYASIPVLKDAINYIVSADLINDCSCNCNAGENFRFFIQNYRPNLASAKKVFEVHKKHIDIQIILSGSEMMYYQSDESVLRPESDYNPDTDCQFFSAVTENNQIVVHGGSFVVFFNGEYHMPSVYNEEGLVTKVVFKIPNLGV